MNNLLKKLILVLDAMATDELGIQEAWDTIINLMAEAKMLGTQEAEDLIETALLVSDYHDSAGIQERINNP